MSVELNQFDKYVYGIAFIFRDIIIQNTNGSYTRVPVIYSQQSKRYDIANNVNIRDSRFPSNTLETNLPVPVMAIEILDFQPYNGRQTNPMNTINISEKPYSPTPHKLEIALNIVTKNANQFWNIYFKVKPWFKPDYSSDIKLNDGSIVEELTLVHTGNVIDIPSVLDENDTRLLRNVMNFECIINTYDLPSTLPDAAEYEFIYENVTNLSDNSIIDLNDEVNEFPLETPLEYETSSEPIIEDILE